MRKLILIVGPTAIGKTSLSIEVAKKFNCEIISADSMQIYKKMDIGTAKITKEEMAGIRHHMIDEVEPDEEFSVSDFRRKSYEYIEEIFSAGNQPLIAGGTGLYVNSLVYDLDFASSERDEALRKKYTDYAEKYGNQYIHDILEGIDSESAQRISVKDTKRIIRAIEVFETTGKKMSETCEDFRKKNKDFDLVYIGLDMDRGKLYDRINRRVDIMLEQGLVEEVRMLLNSGYGRELTSMKAIGYKEVADYIEGKVEYSEMVETLKMNSRRFAKRQLTWFRRDDRIKWFNYDNYDTTEEMYSDIFRYIEDNI